MTITTATQGHITPGSSTSQPDPWPADPARYYVPTDTCGFADGCRIGTSWLLRQPVVEPEEPLMIVQSSEHMSRNPHLSSAGAKIRWATALSFKAVHSGDWAGGPTLLVAPDDSMLAWFESEPRVTALGVIQGVQYDTTPWAIAHRPEDLTRGIPFDMDVDLDPVVEQALLSLERSAVWRGLTSATDIALAVRTLRLLDENGHRSTPLDLEAWALRQCWSPREATRLAAYAMKVESGQYIPLRALARPPRGSLTRWRTRAAADDQGTRRPTSDPSPRSR